MIRQINDSKGRMKMDRYINIEEITNAFGESINEEESNVRTVSSAWLNC